MIKAVITPITVANDTPVQNIAFWYSGDISHPGANNGIKAIPNAISTIPVNPNTPKPGVTSSIPSAIAPIIINAMLPRFALKPAPIKLKISKAIPIGVII